MSIPDDVHIQQLLEKLDFQIADELESQFLDFKPWQGTKEDLRVACEYAVCFANASGGVVLVWKTKYAVAPTPYRVQKGMT